jgi:hypothetical protein
VSGFLANLARRGAGLAPVVVPRAEPHVPSHSIQVEGLEARPEAMEVTEAAGPHPPGPPLPSHSPRPGEGGTRAGDFEVMPDSPEMPEARRHVAPRPPVSTDVHSERAVEPRRTGESPIVAAAAPGAEAIPGENEPVEPRRGAGIKPGVSTPGQRPVFIPSPEGAAEWPARPQPRADGEPASAPSGLGDFRAPFPGVETPGFTPAPPAGAFSSAQPRAVEQESHTGEMRASQPTPILPAPRAPEPALPARLVAPALAPESAEPRIEVRIGRVELRAAPPPAPPPAPAREERRGFEDHALARRYLRRKWY